VKGSVYDMQIVNN